MPSDPNRRLAALTIALALTIGAAACSNGDADRDGAEPSPNPSGAVDPADTEPGDSAESDDTDAGESDPDRWPGGIGTDGVTDWPIAEPEDVGLDPDVLDAMAADAAAEGSTCLLVTRGGHIAAEHHWNGGEVDRAREVFSVTKSFTSILAGIAADDGALAFDDPAATWIPEWRDTPSADVTVDHLLSNDSGREWSLAIDYSEMAIDRDRTGYAVALGQDAEPGEVWVYNNSAIQTLDRVLEQATGQPTIDFGTSRLLEALGMDDSRFTTDPTGNTLTFMGLQSTCRDLARFGVLLLRGGEWNGDRIVSNGYIDTALSPSQDLTSAYGRLFWLNRTGPIASALSPLDRTASAEAPESQLVPDRPETLRWALGLGGQVIQMEPDTDTVVVRLGPAGFSDPTGAGGAGYGPHLTARVLDAITDDAPTDDDDDADAARIADDHAEPTDRNGRG